MTQNPTSSANKFASYLMFIILIVLALSIVALFAAVYAMSLPGSDGVATGFLVIIGLFALGLSTVLLYQTKRRTASMKIEPPKVMTTIECKKCGTKTTREHQRGDYVFKTLDACPKCPEEKQMITAIYKEIKEKEKVYAV